MVTLQEARKVISAAEMKAIEIGQPMNIAVVDEDGNLVSHGRMDGPWIGSIDIAIQGIYFPCSIFQPRTWPNIHNRVANSSEFTFLITAASGS